MKTTLRSRPKVWPAISALAMVLLVAAPALAQSPELEVIRAKAQNTMGLAYKNGRIVTADAETAANWFRKAAEQNFTSAQSLLGTFYLDGKGVAADATEAIKWLRKAADGNYAEAQDNLANLYLAGRAVTKDEAEAAKWYRLAAERDYGGAQNHMVILCAQGNGVAKDTVEACKWFALAEKHSDKDGAVLRAALLKEMSPTQTAEAEKRVNEFVPKP